MTNPGMLLRSALSLLALPIVASAQDLSKYRDFHLGMDLAAAVRQAGVNPEQAKVIQSRPALIQELQWRPQSLSPAAQREPVSDIVFSFYDGKLYRIVVNYDRFETEGLTPDDIVTVLSAAYGTATRPTAGSMTVRGPYGANEDVLAQWQDPQYRLDLARSSFGPSFRLTAVLKSTEASSQVSIQEAKRLDDVEAPQREAARLSSEEAAARTKLEKARLVNKPKFRP